MSHLGLCFRAGKCTVRLDEKLAVKFRPRTGRLGAARIVAGVTFVAGVSNLVDLRVGYGVIYRTRLLPIWNTSSSS